MPVYEFECLQCGKKSEVVLSVVKFEKKSKGGFSCPHCKSSSVQQLLAVSVQTSRKS